MKSEELLQTLTRISGDHGFTQRSVRLLPDNKGTAPSGAAEHHTAEDIEDLLSRWADADGWIARQSGVIIRPEDEDDPSLGAVLEAELGTRTASLQIRRLGAGWVWTELLEEDSGAMLSDDVVLVTTTGKAARYRRYWTLPPDGAAEVIACRLVGFEEIA